MGRHPGSANSPEHNDRISEAISRRYQDDPEYAEQLSQSARRRWVREYNDEVNAVLDECEAGRLQRNLIIGLRAMKRILEDGQQLGDPQRKFVRALRDVTRGAALFNAASTPFVSETQTRHEPMTGRHRHDHVAFGHPDHSDGLHLHEHEHDNDADHDHLHPGGERPGRVSGPGQEVRGHEGSYGRQMNAIGPLERRRLKDAQIREQEARNQGLL